MAVQAGKTAGLDARPYGRAGGEDCRAGCPALTFSLHGPGWPCRR